MRQRHSTFVLWFLLFAGSVTLALFGLWRQQQLSPAGISRIELQDVEPMVPAGYSIEFDANGTALFRGDRQNFQPGTWRGTIPRPAFQLLAEEVANSGFYSMRPHFTSDYTDQNDIYLSVTRKGKVRSLSDNGSSGPASLEKLEAGIDDLRKKVKWQAD